MSRREFEAHLYYEEGEAAMRHLFRVAAGLDSLVVGENEILGQLREAFRLANEKGHVHSLLYRLFEKTLKLGKEVRTVTKINEGAVSIPAVAVELAQKIFGQLSGEKVMVLGTGQMGELTLQNLSQSGAEPLYVVSRSAESGQEVANRFGLQWLSMDAWASALTEVDILIASTAAPHVIVHPPQVRDAMARRRNRPLLLIDIAVPRNIEDDVHKLEDVYLYNIDDLQGVSAANLKLRQREVKQAEALAEKEVVFFRGWLERLKAPPNARTF